MSKSIPIRLKPKNDVQAFVEAGEEPRARELRASAEKGETVRVTLDLPRGQYRKLKLHVADKETTIATYLRGLLDSDLQ